MGSSKTLRCREVKVEELKKNEIMTIMTARTTTAVADSRSPNVLAISARVSAQIFAERASASA